MNNPRIRVLADKILAFRLAQDLAIAMADKIEITAAAVPEPVVRADPGLEPRGAQWKREQRGRGRRR